MKKEMMIEFLRRYKQIILDNYIDARSLGTLLSENAITNLLVFDVESFMEDLKSRCVRYHGKKRGDKRFDLYYSQIKYVLLNPDALETNHFNDDLKLMADDKLLRHRKEMEFWNTLESMRIIATNPYHLKSPFHHADMLELLNNIQDYKFCQQMEMKNGVYFDLSHRNSNFRMDFLLENLNDGPEDEDAISAMTRILKSK